MNAIDRRQLLQNLLRLSIGGAMALESAGEALAAASKANWAIGCFSRPWSRWSYDEALDGMKAAGFRLTGLLGDHKGEQFIYPDATAEYLDTLRKRIEQRGLEVISARMQTRFGDPLDEVITTVRKQIDNAARLKLRYVMTLGTDRPAEYERFYTVMSDAAAHAQDRHIRLVFKPHGGCTASADEILHCIERVNHPNFHLWYDAGNIIYYTGKDPSEDVKRVAGKVTGFCAKDCAKPQGDVMIPFGEGKVDFPAVFGSLKTAGYSGPVMIECCGGKSLEEVTESARANRVFLERVRSAI